MKLEYLEELLNKATPRPWELKGHEVLFDHDQYATGNGISDCRSQVVSSHNHCPVVDLELIVALRNAGPELLEIARAVLNSEKKALVDAITKLLELEQQKAENG